MTENNSTDKHIENDLELNTLQHEQLIALRKENHQLRLKINYEKERKVSKKSEYEQKLHKLQILINDASNRLNEGSELIRKLQHHLKICQEKVIIINYKNQNFAFFHSIFKVI
jgi:hypothetical protein